MLNQSLKHQWFPKVLTVVHKALHDRAPDAYPTSFPILLLLPFRSSHTRSSRSLFPPGHCTTHSLAASQSQTKGPLITEALPVPLSYFNFPHNIYHLLTFNMSLLSPHCSVNCRIRVGTLLDVWYFYLLNLATLSKKAGTVVILFIAVSSAVELLLTRGKLSINIYAMNEWTCSTGSLICNMPKPLINNMRARGLGRLSWVSPVHSWRSERPMNFLSRWSSWELRLNRPCASCNRTLPEYSER